MNKKLLRSLSSLALVLALGGGATYALFTSNTVTISNNHLTTGEAEIKLCNSINSTPAGANNWRNTIDPSMSLSDLAPGDTNEELTDGKVLYLGNDGGNLPSDTDLTSGECTTYFDTAGSSDVDLVMVPNLTNLVCTDPLDDQFRLKFDFGGTLTDYKTLTEWDSNTLPVGPTFSPDDAKRVKIFAELHEDATLQDTTCTFDVTFTGEQVLPI